jgi:3-deoxy-manno-octulosonate cytidylyltransferase (CMP-KDO synthetase)
VVILGVIPARLRSTRLPRKALREIAGVPMVVQVFRQASRASVLSDLLVATDSDEIVEACHAHHVPAVMTRADHPSGTDRLWEVSRARAADVYVNIQGDYPTITPGHIERLVRPFLNEPEVQVTTLKIRATREEVESPTVNKVVTNVHGDALEQLRLLEAGIPIHVLETHEPIIGVDTEEDLRAAEAQLASRPR